MNSTLVTTHILKWIATSALTDSPASPFIRFHGLSRIIMLPTIHCATVIQFREMLAAAAKRHCYTLRRPIWKKPPNRLHNHRAPDKSCLVLIFRSSCSQNTTTMLFFFYIADEPVSRGREGCPGWTHGTIYTWKWCLFNRIINSQLRKKHLRFYQQNIHRFSYCQNANVCAVELARSILLWIYPHGHKEKCKYSYGLV